MNIKKISFVTLFCFIAVISCGSKNVRLSDQVGGEIKDLKLATDFTDEGVKVIYTLAGNLKSIEVHAKEFNGIVYYIDSSNRIYKTEDVLTEKQTPLIIGNVIQRNGVDVIEFV